MRPLEGACRDGASRRSADQPEEDEVLDAGVRAEGSADEEREEGT